MSDLGDFASELDARFGQELKEQNILRTPGIQVTITIPPQQEMELMKLIYLLWGVERHHPRKAVIGTLTFVR
jgi:hypothetical protein